MLPGRRGARQAPYVWRKAYRHVWRFLNPLPGTAPKLVVFLSRAKAEPATMGNGAREHQDSAAEG